MKFIIHLSFFDFIYLNNEIKLKNINLLGIYEIKYLKNQYGDWGIGDWGLGIGDLGIRDGG